MKGKSFLGIAVVAVVCLSVGLVIGQKQPAGTHVVSSLKGTAPSVIATRQSSVAEKPYQPVIPTTEDLKIWVRYNELLAKLPHPEPEDMEKLSEEERTEKLNEMQEARKKGEADALMKLHEEFSQIPPTDIPLILRKAQEFIAVITPRYYAIQEDEVKRLQTAGAFSEASLPLIRLQALQQLSKEFPSIGEQGIKQLLRLETPVGEVSSK